MGAEQRTPKAIQQCAEWLAACVRLGWDKSELDALEALWWKYRDHRGNLIVSGTVERDAKHSDPARRSAAPK